MASVDSPSILPGRLTGTGTDKIAVVPRKSVKRLFVQAKLKLHHNGARLLPLCAFVTMMAISFLLFDIFSANPTSVAVADAYPWFDDMDDVGDERYYSHFLSEMDDDSVESRYPPASGDSSDNSPFGHFRIDFRAGTGKVSGRRRGRRRVPPAVHRRAAMRRRMRIDLLALAALITACSAAFLWTRKLQLKLQEEEAAVEALQKDKRKSRTRNRILVGVATIIVAGILYLSIDAAVKEAALKEAALKEAAVKDAAVKDAGMEGVDELLFAGSGGCGRRFCVQEASIFFATSMIPTVAVGAMTSFWIWWPGDRRCYRLNKLKKNNADPEDRNVGVSETLRATRRVTRMHCVACFSTTAPTVSPAFKAAPNEETTTRGGSKFELQVGLCRWE